MNNILRLMLLAFLISHVSTALAERYNLCGRIIDKNSRSPIPDAAVTIYGNPSYAAKTDSIGTFCIPSVPPDIYRLSISHIGYAALLSPEYMVGPQLPIIELELEENTSQISEVVVRSSPLRKRKESPVSLQVIGLNEIEKSPGANRDVARILRSYPGVASSIAGYRNDLIVRGGAPSENRFYIDGVEIPNINHFATQGASGGAVSLLNADLIREVQFYSAAFPVDKSGALSSVIDMKLRNGNIDKHTFKATLGASEVSLSGTGHLRHNTSYLFSIRQSYLQLLFKLFQLPFLPNFIDAQFKIKTTYARRHEITLLGLTGIDDMKLNTNQTGEDAEYILSYLPRIRQQTYTVGAVYKHYADRSTQSLTLSYNFLHNNNLKYRNNDDTQPENKTLDLNSNEQKVSLKAENRNDLQHWTLTQGVDAYFLHYYNRTFQQLFSDSAYISRYRTACGILGWGTYASARYKSPDEHFSLLLGMRLDASNYAPQLTKIWKQFSPRVSASYRLSSEWSVNAASGIFHQLPPSTALGFKNSLGTFVNKQLKYIRLKSFNLGTEYNKDERLVLSLEAFYKIYDNAPLSVNDQIPLACKGNDYGTVGNEALISAALGRSYGLEASLRWQIPSTFNLVSSFTLYKCNYRNSSDAPSIPSAWDNRFIFNLLGTYNLPRNWSVGMKFYVIGGAPYTPYDLNKSSLVQAWNASGRPYYDYSQYNKYRLRNYAQLDIRLDKNFYFHKWMLGFYVDIQNLTKSTYREQDVPISTGVIDNPQADITQQHYRMKYLKQESGTLIPTIGATVTF